VYDKFHGWVGVHYGQYIIRGTQGEFYPIDPDALEATYYVTVEKIMSDDSTQDSTYLVPTNEGDAS
jgi:hypothetical protein